MDAACRGAALAMRGYLGCHAPGSGWMGPRRAVMFVVRFSELVADHPECDCEGKCSLQVTLRGRMTVGSLLAWRVVERRFSRPDE